MHRFHCHIRKHTFSSSLRSCSSLRRTLWLASSSGKMAASLAGNKRVNKGTREPRTKHVLRIVSDGAGQLLSTVILVKDVMCQRLEIRQMCAGFQIVTERSEDELKRHTSREPFSSSGSPSASGCRPRRYPMGRSWLEPVRH